MNPRVISICRPAAWLGSMRLQLLVVVFCTVGIANVNAAEEFTDDELQARAALKSEIMSACEAGMKEKEATADASDKWPALSHWL